MLAVLRLWFPVNWSLFHHFTIIVVYNVAESHSYSYLSFSRSSISPKGFRLNFPLDFPTGSFTFLAPLVTQVSFVQVHWLSLRQIVTPHGV